MGNACAKSSKVAAAAGNGIDESLEEIGHALRADIERIGSAVEHVVKE